MYIVIQIQIFTQSPDLYIISCHPPLLSLSSIYPNPFFMQKPPILTRKNPQFPPMRDQEFGVGSGGDLQSNGGGRMAAPERRDLPPPISCMAKAEDLPLPSHVPWVMRRYHTSDGRLIIKEEKVRRRDYFVADRSDGRLVMYLVHVDDAAEEGGDVELCDGDAAEEEEYRSDSGDEGKGDLTVEAEEVAYKYTGVGVKPCGGFVETAPVFMPPVHI